MPRFYNRALLLRNSAFYNFPGIHNILPGARRHKLAHEGFQKEGLFQTDTHPARSRTTPSRGIL